MCTLHASSRVRNECSRSFLTMKIRSQKGSPGRASTCWAPLAIQCVSGARMIRIKPRTRAQAHTCKVLYLCLMSPLSSGRSAESWYTPVCNMRASQRHMVMYTWPFRAMPYLQDYWMITFHPNFDCNAAHHSGDLETSTSTCSWLSL